MEIIVKIMKKWNISIFFSSDFNKTMNDEKVLLKI